MSVDLSQCLAKDRPALQRLETKIAQRIKRQQPTDHLQSRLESQWQQSATNYQQRSATTPKITYPDLPVASQRDKLVELIRDNQVVVLAGETGSGKTTQLPKLCLEAGQGLRGLIGHTQPRRLAARTVAQRIAEELQVPLGQQVGYQVRFNEQVSDNTLVKLMTDGILLAETRHDPDLLRYDTIIVDEAHERSLNIDFLLGYLKQLLARRADLKLIITSATIDVERFAKHFNNAPVVEVSGRTYPVDTWYRPLFQGRDNESRQTDAGNGREQALLDGVEQALTEIEHHERDNSQLGGDVLIFLPGERDIRELAQFLRKLARPQWQIMPLYGRLSFAEQQKVFQTGGAGRRIILATNVAETSVTVPGIRYVIDPGTARISRYSYRSKVQRLPIEAISQASANQRKGRCGRVAAGICIRLYDETDFLGRPEFSDAEILR
ncbi:MAG: helicase-related protein, partial [Pseudomonadales bacterium]